MTKRLTPAKFACNAKFPELKELLTKQANFQCCPIMEIVSISESSRRVDKHTEISCLNKENWWTCKRTISKLHFLEKSNSGMRYSNKLLFQIGLLLN